MNSVNRFVKNRAAVISLAFNIEKAKSILNEVGITAATMPSLELLAPSSDEYALVTQYIQDQLKNALGLTIETRLPEFKTFRTQLDLQTAPMFIRCWGLDYADADSFFEVFVSNSGNSKTGWKNAEYDALVTKAGSIQDFKERGKLYKKALQILLRDEAPVIPLYYDTLAYLLNPRVKGFFVNPLNYIFFKDIVFTAK